MSDSVQAPHEQEASLYLDYLPAIFQDEAGGDFLGVRLAVNGKAYPQSGTHHRPIGYTATPNTTLTGQLTLSLNAGQHTVQLQWYKGGTVLQSWSCATASLGEGDAEGFLSGRSLQAVAYYR